MYNYRKEQEDAGISLPDISSCQLIVDSGYSFTHAIPYFDYHPINGAIKRLRLQFIFTCIFNPDRSRFRLNVGGKLLTNVLKETISFR